MPKHIQTFIGGMNKDISPNKYDDKSYFHAENLRLIPGENQTAGSFENISGDSQLFNLNYNSQYNDWRSLGECTIRNYLIVFSRSNLANADRIYKITFSESETSPSGYLEVLFEGNLGFTQYTKVACIGRYESPDIQKVYWSDGVTPLRFANIATDISGYSESEFNILPETTVNVNWTLSAVSGGQLKSGSVQYAYQLYNLYGQEAPFSSPSKLVPISNNQLGEYYGANINTECNKSVTGTIGAIDSRFDRVRVISIFYSQEYSSPTINIIGEYKNIGYVNFVDTGSNYIGTYTPEELSFISQEFSCTLLESKNDYLFAGNIKYSEFDFDYDARAYRFSDNGNLYLSLIGNNSNYRTELYYVKSDGHKETHPQKLTSNGWVWDDSKTHSYDSWIIPEDYNCINETNNTAYYLQNEVFERNIHGELGGTGNNVSFKIKRIDDTIDQGTDLKKFTPNSTATLRTHFHSDEVYRIGIVGFDIKGRKSNVKWICDVRMPSTVRNGWQPFISTDVTKSMNVIARNTYIEVSVTNLPDSVKSYQIVYVKRKESDKSIKASGLISASVYEAESTSCMMSGAPVNEEELYSKNYYCNGRASNGKPVIANVFNLISPEVSFNTSQNITGQYLDMFGEYYSDQSLHMSYEADNYIRKYGSVNCTESGPYIKPILARRQIKDVKKLGESTHNEYYNITGISQRYRHRGFTLNGANIWNTYACSNLVTSINNSWDDTSTLPLYVGDRSYRFLYGYIRSDVFKSQYGGNTYQARLSNEYIPCSDIVSARASYVNAYGDTYICPFSVLYTYKDKDHSSTSCGKIVFPVESSINLWYRTDQIDSWFTTKDDLGWFLTERASLGVEMWTDEDTGAVLYPQYVTDLYQYNSVYSKASDLLSYIPKQQDVSTNKIFDTRIHYSDKKTNGELSDSWLKFRLANFRDVDSAYGKLTKLFMFKDQMMFFQSLALGTLPVERQSTIVDNNSITTVLGVGNVLDRYDYISTTNGCEYPNSVVITPDAFYWYDKYNKGIYSSRDSLAVSKIEGMMSYLNNIKNATNVCAGYNKNNEEVLFTIMSDSGAYPVTLQGIVSNVLGNLFTAYFPEDMYKYGLYIGQPVSVNGMTCEVNWISKTYDDYYVRFKKDNHNISPGLTVELRFSSYEYVPTRKTIALSNLNGKFSHIPTMHPSKYISINKLFITTNSGNKFYSSGTGKKCKFGSSDLASPSKLTLVLNPNNGVANRFDILEWMSEVFENNSQLSETISSIRIYNSYQDTGVIEINPQVNAIQRFRTWRFNNLRNQISLDRIKDAYVMIDIVFNNDGVKRFVLHDFTTTYMPLTAL